MVQYNATRGALRQPERASVSPDPQGKGRPSAQRSYPVPPYPRTPVKILSKVGLFTEIEGIFAV